MRFFAFFLKTTESAPNFFQGLGKNTCSLQPALKVLRAAFLVEIQKVYYASWSGTQGHFISRAVFQLLILM